MDVNLNIIDYNKSFADNFRYISGLHKGENFNRILNKWNCKNVRSKDFRELIKSSAQTNNTHTKDVEIDLDGIRQYFTVEFTPIIQRSACVAIILLFKNITQHIKDLETIQENQAILLERERLASLGQLIGGIAHNLKTPIMSIAGGIDQLRWLAEEYESSVEDNGVTKDDHREIAAEMQQWLGKMKTHVGYMSDIISTVKDQATQFNIQGRSWFTLSEMLKRVQILMQHEMVKHNCRYRQDILVEPMQRINGDINSSGGEIVLRATREGNSLLISVRDFGKGIDAKIKDRLFKEMVTTKGKHGTGLGLYMSYSTIKGVFRGNMWFDSNVNIGTVFYIQLPLPSEQTIGDNQYA
jgi:signal transduction histidine kinase